MGIYDIVQARARAASADIKPSEIFMDQMESNTLVSQFTFWVSGVHNSTVHIRVHITLSHIFQIIYI